MQLQTNLPETDAGTGFQSPSPLINKAAAAVAGKAGPLMHMALPPASAAATALPQAGGLPAGVKAVYSNCVPAGCAATFLHRLPAACPGLCYVPAAAGSPQQQARPRRSARVWLLHRASQSQHNISFDRHGKG